MAKRIPVDTQQLRGVILRQIDGMRNDKKHCDFVIKVDSEEIPVHRNILSATSDYFDAMFSHPTRENKSGVVDMIGVDPECAIICVDHMYGKEVSILPKKYEPLMCAANLMQLHTLRDAIATLLEANLDPNSFFAAKRIAGMYGCKKLEEKCNEFAEENLSLISKEKEFGELDKSYIKKIIRSEDWDVSGEEKLHAALKWIKYGSERTEDLPDLIDLVNLAQVSVRYRRYVAENEPLVCGNPELFKKISLSMFDTMKIDSKNVLSEVTNGPAAIAVFDGTSGHLQCFNPVKNTWRQIQPMNEEMKRVRFSAVTVGDFIYVLMQNKSVYRLKYLDKTGSWIRMADMIETHGSCPPAAVLWDNMYVTGGNDVETKCIEKYDTALNQWTKLQNKPQSSAYSCVLPSGGYIYEFGGIVGGRLTSEFCRFDPTSSTWEKIASMSESKGCMAVVELKCKIYVLGGLTPGTSTRFRTAEVYDRKSKQWATLHQMTTLRSSFRAFAIDNNIYAVGGDTNSPGSIEKYDVEKNEWKIVEIPSGIKLNILESVQIRAPE